MKKLLAVVLFLFSTAVTAQTYMLLPIVSVYDGDTIKTNLSWRLPTPLNKVSIRILNLDTPEMPAKSYLVTGKLGRAKCIKEAVMAIKAKEFVEKLTNGYTKMKVENFKYGKWGGRIVADVSIGGIDIGAALIKKGLAIEYSGGTKTHDWCN